MTRGDETQRQAGLTLAIEMSNPSVWADPLIAGEVALGVIDERTEMLGVEPIVLRSPRDEALAPAIDRLLKGAGVEPSHLERVAVSAGPGGYTSVRVAVTTAKLIAEAIGAGVVIVPTDEAAARHAVKRGGWSGAVMVTLAGKRDSAWCAVFEPGAWDGGPWAPPLFAGVVEAGSVAGRPEFERVGSLLADAHTPAGVVEWARERGVEVIETGLSAEAALAASRFLDAVDAVTAAPIYPREPEAVTKWRDLHG